jgi:orotidine-5'-phosphate decarboxylase
MQNNPIICAIDKSDLQEAKNLATLLHTQLGMIKLGLEFFTTCGPSGVEEIAKLKVPIFLDLKFHDIPNTVAKSIAASAKLGVAMTTIHLSGGAEMVKAAVESAANASPSKPLIIGVTMLTSLTEESLKTIGIGESIKDQVLKLALLAKQNGADGVVCSPQEIAILRAEFGEELKLIVPGIRLKENEADDQKRVMTPREALKIGADYLVIGRPITSALDPLLKLQEIRNSLV